MFRFVQSSGLCIFRRMVGNSVEKISVLPQLGTEPVNLFGLLLLLFVDWNNKVVDVVVVGF